MDQLTAIKDKCNKKFAEHLEKNYNEKKRDLKFIPDGFDPEEYEPKGTDPPLDKDNRFVADSYCTHKKKTTA